MRKRYGLLAIACGALLATPLTLWLTREREPVYKGRELSYWARIWRGSYRDTVHWRAEEAILAIGTNNLDLLLRRVSYDPEHDILVNAFHYLPARVHMRLYSTSLARRLAWRNKQADDAQLALRVLGPAAAPAIPQLSKLLDKGAGIPADRALNVLTHLGEQGLAVLTSRVPISKGPMHFQLISALADHTNYPPAFAVLTNALNDPDPNIRTEAANILAGRVFE